ncbi:MAG: hypothetical protein ACR2JC_19765, partial [Chloroflexota bacterium]
MGSRGDCHDHAVSESFFASVECELLDGPPGLLSTPMRTASTRKSGGYGARLFGMATSFRGSLTPSFRVSTQPGQVLNG